MSSTSSTCSSSTEDFEDNVSNAKRQILSILSELNDPETNELARWFVSEDFKKDLKTTKQIHLEKLNVERIAGFLREELSTAGPDGVLVGEVVSYPTVGNLADCTKTNTITIDEFLYDNDRFDEMAKSGDISKYYCHDCGSKKCEESIVLTHSTGVIYLQLMFKYLLPADLGGKTLVDVGSRIGAVLFGAYYMSNLSQIIGIEMNKELCEIQKKCFDKFKMDQNRIKVIDSDIIDEKEVLKRADILVINVIDCFVDTETQIGIWNMLKSCLRKGTFLVTMRSIPETLTALEVFEEFATWLSCAKPCQMENEIYCDAISEDCANVYLYKVD